MTIDAKILRALRSARSGSVSGAELSSDLGISRAAIWARIEELRKMGYDIEASPHLGYRLLHVPDLLNPDDLLARLDSPKVIGKEILVFQETTSTNDVIERMALEGKPEGVVVFAESQTKGRGRLGRRWTSPPGKGLWFSLLLRPKLRPTSVTQVTLAAATALVRAIREETKLEPRIKWPNDILIQGKKVAGVLTELSAELDRVHFVVLGIGVDVNVQSHEFSPEFRHLATSLALESGTKVDRAALASRLLQELDRDYDRISRGDFEKVVEEWEERCTTIGQNVSIQIGPRQITGLAESVDEEGALLVRTQHGRLERIIGGDVTIAK